MGGLSFTTLAVLIVSPLVGLAADRFGVRRVALLSVALFGLCFMGFALGNGSLTLYYATWTLMAVLGAGTLPITWTRAVNDVFQQRKGLALGLSLVGTGIFGFVVKPLTTWLIAEFGWRGAYVAIGALPLLLALPVGLLYFRDSGQDRFGQDQSAPGAGEGAQSVRPLGLSMRETLRDWRFWLLGISILLVAFAVGGIIPNMENILRIAGFVRANVVALASLIGLSVVAGRLIGGWLLDRFWAPGVAVILLGAPAFACVLLARGDMSYTTAAVAICLVGVAAGVEYDLVAFLVARYFGMKSYGAIYGALYGFYALGAGLGPVAFGADFDRHKSYQFSLYLACGLFLVPAIAMLLLGRYREFGVARPPA
jgi:MFS family permease